MPSNSRSRSSSGRRGTRKPLPRRLVTALSKAAAAFLLLSLLWVLAYKAINPPMTATMAADILAGRGANRTWLPIDHIDRDMVRAAIAAEDSKFCSHQGFDLKAIEDAAKRNASGGRIRGGSTISQQAAKNAFLWQGGGYVRKGVEAWFTFLIEHLWGKRRIMEVYLNLAETGIGTYGVNAGSMRYFGHDASSMSAIEAARIAAVLPLPKKRGAVAPVGFTRRYGSIIVARLGTVGRDRLDACVYAGAKAPMNKAPPVQQKSTRPMPGSDYESEKPPLPAPDVDQAPPETAPAIPEPGSSPQPNPLAAQDEPPVPADELPVNQQ